MLGYAPILRGFIAQIFAGVLVIRVRIASRRPHARRSSAPDRNGCRPPRESRRFLSLAYSRYSR